MMDTGEKRKHHFQRRAAAAREGRHLPVLDELIKGCPFLGDSQHQDAQAFAERFLGRFDPTGDEALTRLHGALQALTVSPSVNEYRAAQSAFLTVYRQQKEQDPFPEFEVFDLDEREGEKQRARWMWRTKGLVPFGEEHAVRCALYAACAGYREAAWIVAAHASAMAVANHQSDGRAYAAAALGWLSLAGPLVPSAEKRLLQFTHYCKQPVQAVHRIQVLAEQIIEESDDPPVVTKPRRGSTWPTLAEKAKEPEQEDEEPEATAQQDGIRVITAIGNAETPDGKKVVKEFEKLVNAQLPLLPLPDLAAIRRELAAEFPYATDVVDRLLHDLAPRNHVRFQPTVLIGDPGGGKTRFARRFLGALGGRSEVYSCGGVSDSSLAGTARRWSTGEPSLPVSLIQRWRTASPGIVLDEIEKVGTGRHNGNVLDSLLGLLEPSSAAVWHDPYIESACDLSHVLWFATANSMEGVPAPVRDRCRIVRFPNPGPEHMEVLVAALLRDIAADRGLDARWFSSLDGEELAALREVWPGGSVRALRRLVEGVLDIRGFEGGLQ